MSNWQIFLVFVGAIVVILWAVRVEPASRRSRIETDAKAILDRIQTPIPAPTAPVKPGDFFNIHGRGEFNVHVAGSSHCQDALLNICGGKHAKSGWHKHVEATLIREPENPHDRNAVRVEIDGKKVGYIPAEMAPLFDHLVQNIPLVCHFKVPALVIGGWHNELEDDGFFGVRLDM